MSIQLFVICFTFGLGDTEKLPGTRRMAVGSQLAATSCDSGIPQFGAIWEPISLQFR